MEHFVIKKSDLAKTRLANKKTLINDERVDRWSKPEQKLAGYVARRGEQPVIYVGNIRPENPSNAAGFERITFAEAAKIALNAICNNDRDRAQRLKALVQEYKAALTSKVALNRLPNAPLKMGRNVNGYSSPDFE